MKINLNNEQVKVVIKSLCRSMDTDTFACERETMESVLDAIIAGYEVDNEPKCGVPSISEEPEKCMEFENTLDFKEWNKGEDYNVESINGNLKLYIGSSGQFGIDRIDCPMSSKVFFNAVNKNEAFKAFCIIHDFLSTFTNLEIIDTSELKRFIRKHSPGEIHISTFKISRCCKTGLCISIVLLNAFTDEYRYEFILDHSAEGLMHIQIKDAEREKELLIDNINQLSIIVDFLKYHCEE